MNEQTSLLDDRDLVTRSLMQPGQRVCPKCGGTHYADEAPIDWAKVKDHASKRKTGQGDKE